MTGRLPFDPKKMLPREPAPPAPPAPSAPPPPGSDPEAPLSVSTLSTLIDGALRGGLPASIRVLGEVSNFTDRQHWYFALKDAGGVVNCVMFAFKHRHATVRPRDGMQAVITGRVEYYKPRGQVSFYVEKFAEAGVGPLEAALRALVEEARALGWLDDERKRELPFFPRRVAVITSRTGAALADVLDTMRRRCPAVEVCFIDTLVQGASAAPDVARAIAWASRNAATLGIDAILLTRGGGSIEDLWAFNDRGVAEAIVRSSVPVAAAIGHETDTTLAELVADARCATPTQAAMRLTPDRAALGEQLALLAGRIAAGQRRAIAAAADHLARDARDLATAPRRGIAERGRVISILSARLERCRPIAVLERRRADLRESARQLAASVQQRLAELDLPTLAASLRDSAARLAAARADTLAHLARQLELVGPMNTLRRGYSVTLDELGRVVRRTADAPPGATISTRLIDGEVRSRVHGPGAAPADLSPPAPPTPPAPTPAVRPARRRAANPDAPEPGLFG